MENTLLVAIEELLKGLREDASNSNSSPMFKKVISNNSPIWTSVEVTPAVCFYLSDTEYEDYDGLRYNGKARVVIYIYNKHKTRGLSLKDILTTYISAIRNEVQKLPKLDSSILTSFVSKVSRDGGTILPYTVAELTVEIDFVEAKGC